MTKLAIAFALALALVAPASAADINMADCKPHGEYIWQKRTIKQIDKDNTIMLDNNTCYGAFSDIVQQWHVGDEILVEQFAMELINQSRGNEGVPVISDAGGALDPSYGD